ATDSAFRPGRMLPMMIAVLSIVIPSGAPPPDSALEAPQRRRQGTAGSIDRAGRDGCGSQAWNPSCTAGQFPGTRPQKYKTPEGRGEREMSTRSDPSQPAPRSKSRVEGGGSVPIWL